MTTLQGSTDHSNEAVVYFGHKRQPTILEVADAEKYERYETVVRFFDHAVEPAWTVPHDEFPKQAVYRFAIVLRVVPSAQRFVIRLRPGAGEKDLAFAQEQIDLIRAGHFNGFPWEQRLTAHGQVFYTISIGEPLPVQHAEVRARSWFERCDLPGCTDAWHEVEGTDDVYRLHTAERIKSGDWTILVQRENDKPWGVFTDFDNSGGDMFTVEEAVSFANDLRWAAATCAKLNAPKAAA